MEAKKTGLSPELIIHPGETIADLLAERGMSQQELAARTGVTSAFVSNVINGKKGISGNFAYALECAFGVPKTFWLNLQANYEAEILDAREYTTITDEEKVIAQGMRESVQELCENRDIMLEQKDEDIIPYLRRKFHVSNLAYLGKLQRHGFVGQPQA
ncbi:MAG: HigA family addiction module antidote protein [Selenomonadaceae bacterium]|nr:HigA family addiction module antidote protein [Selenomonadaceae bacterium]